MWRRLPYAHKQKPHDLSLRARRRSATCRRIDIPAGRATLGARRPSARADRSSTGAVVAFGWDNEFDALAVDVPGFDIDAHSVTNAEFLRVHRRPRLSAAGVVGRRVVGVARGRAGRPSGVLVAVGGQRRRCLGLARHVRRDSAAARLARLRQPGGGCGVRALEGTPAAERGRVSPRRVWQPRGRSANSRGAPRRRGRRTAISISSRGSRCRPAHVRRARARGACTIWSATAGSGPPASLRRSPALRRCRRTRNTRPSSSMAATSC